MLYVHLILFPSSQAYPMCGTAVPPRQILVEMNCIDVVNNIDRALMEDQGKPTLINHGHSQGMTKGISKPISVIFPYPGRWQW